MTEYDDKITAAAKAFSRASSDLGEALQAKLQPEQPDMAATIGLAVERGRRMQLRMEWHLPHPKIEWVAIDNRDRAFEIMSIAAPPLSRQCFSMSGG